MEPLVVNPPDKQIRPAEICQALLAALEASEGRRRRRKRDTTPDAIGLSIKRRLLERAVQEDPEPQRFEQWLLYSALAIDADVESSGAARAMARNIFEDWQMFHRLDNFREWLDAGAPSEDAWASDTTTERHKDGLSRTASR
jgi:hypothetical protein